MKRIRSVLLLGMVLGLGACTPSPEKVCAHAAQLAGGGGSSPESAARHQQECLTGMTRLRAEHPAEYKTAAKCIMDATNSDGMMACIRPVMSMLGP